MAIVTDSTACLPADVVSQYAVGVIPLFLVFDDHIHRDDITIDANEFYESLRSARKPPTTAAPSPGIYAEAIVRAAQDADAVLCITVSRQFSVMYDAAMQGAALARRQAPELDVRVLDSGAAAMAQGFIVLAAARAAHQGLAIDGVIEAAEALIPRVELLVTLDTLTYLGRSGRVPRLLVWAASPLQVKPVVEFQRGKYHTVALVRTSARAVDRLVQVLEQRTQRGALHVCVQHSNVPKQAEALAERVRAALAPAELSIAEFTQVMGVHTGPGLLGFAFYCGE